MEAARSPATTGVATVGRYVLVRELRAKGRAAYYARQEGATSEVFVVECIGDAVAGGARGRELLSLHHPNVARMREVLEAGGQAYLVTDYSDGATLSDLLKAASDRGVRIPLEAHLRALVDVLNGLSALHAHSDAKRRPLKVVHGVVSPHAALVSADGTTRLTWLGRAPLDKPPAEAVAYASPEVLGGKGTVDGRADLYSVGVMLWEALTGRALFEPEAAAVLTQHAVGPIALAVPPAEDTWATPLAAVASRALETDPSARFATAAEMAAEIRKIAKAKLGLATRVAAVVTEMLGEELRTQRDELQGAPALANVALPQPEPVRAMRKSPFGGSEEAPTVPKRPPQSASARPELKAPEPKAEPALAREPEPQASLRQPTTQSEQEPTTQAEPQAEPTSELRPERAKPARPPLPPRAPPRPPKPVIPSSVLAIAPVADTAGQELEVKIASAPLPVADVSEPPIIVSAANDAPEAQPRDQETHATTGEASIASIPPPTRRRERSMVTLIAVLAACLLLLAIAGTRALLRTSDHVNDATDNAASHPTQARAPLPPEPTGTSAQPPAAASTPNPERSAAPPQSLPSSTPGDTASTAPPSVPADQSRTEHPRHPEGAGKPTTKKPSGPAHYDPSGI